MDTNGAEPEASGVTITIVAERPDSTDAALLITELDDYLSSFDYPIESCHAYSIEKLVGEQVAFFVTRVNGKPAGCGGVKLFGMEYGEVKRMYVRSEFRGMGLAKTMLQHLANYVQAQGIRILRLETGLYQQEAICLYERFGFQRRSAFGDYRPDPLSVYFEFQI